MAGTPLTELETFNTVINELDEAIRAELNSTNDSARADISLLYTFNNDGTITIRITTVRKSVNSETQTLGTVTTNP